jgi:signal peptidase I
MSHHPSILFKGKSMYPTLQSGDELFVSPELSSLEVGDIVIYKDAESNELIAHRVVRNNPIMTKGDRAQFIDQSFPLLYKVIGIKDQCPWKNGQPLKKAIAKLSLLNDKHHLRAIRLISIMGIYIFSFFKNHQ